MSIFIYGYYGWHNTGDDGMLYALLLRYDKEIGGEHYLVVARQPTVLPGISGTVEWVKCGVWPALRAIAKSSKVVIGGGTHISDYGLTHRTVIILSRILALFGFAKLLGKRIELIGNGITVTKKWSQILIRPILWLVDRAEMRDTESYRVARKWCRAGVATKGEDLTYGLLPYINEKADNDTLGLVVSPIYDIYEGDWLKEIQTMARITGDINERLKNNARLKVKIIVFKGKSKDDDVNHSSYYYNLINPKERVEIVGYKDNPIEMINEVAKCGRLISMRYHSCYIAAILGIPLEIETPHPKCKHLARGIFGL